MRLFLVVLNILSYGTALYLVLRGPYIESRDIVMMVSIVVLNLMCAWFLYSKAKTYKIEWSLFGLCGNLNAILIWWISTDILDRWRKGKSYFS